MLRNVRFPLPGVFRKLFFGIIDRFQVILDLEIGPQSSRKSPFSKSFEEVVFEGYGPDQKSYKLAGNQRFATVYMVIRKIRSSIYVYMYRPSNFESKRALGLKFGVLGQFHRRNQYPEVPQNRCTKTNPASRFSFSKMLFFQGGLRLSLWFLVRLGLLYVYIYIYIYICETYR